MKTEWEQAWDDATVAERKTVRYWKAGFGRDPHRNGMRGDKNQCSGCGELFSSGSAFEKHRTGPFGVKGKPSNRRCLTVAEMVSKGYLKNATGFWIRGANPLYRNASNPSCI